MTLDLSGETDRLYRGDFASLVETWLRAESVTGHQKPFYGESPLFEAGYTCDQQYRELEEWSQSSYPFFTASDSPRTYDDQNRWLDFNGVSKSQLQTSYNQGPLLPGTSSNPTNLINPSASLESDDHDTETRVTLRNAQQV